MGLTADFYKGKVLLPRETKSRLLKISKRIQDLQDLSKSLISIISRQLMGNEHTGYGETRKLNCQRVHTRGIFHQIKIFFEGRKHHINMLGQHELRNIFS